MSLDQVVIPHVGDLIGGRYRVDSELGRGSTGTVFSATHQANRVTVKVLSAPLTDESAGRFQVLAGQLASLTHPNTVRVLDFGVDGVAYLVMEHLVGAPLGDTIAGGHPLSIERTQRIVVQILKSLAEAHSSGLVHANLHPNNVFLCDVAGEEDFVKVLDIGLARLGGGLVPASPYAAPGGERWHPSVDLFAVGVIAHELVLGRRDWGSVELSPSLSDEPLGKLMARCLGQGGPRYDRASQALADLVDWDQLSTREIDSLRSEAPQGGDVPVASDGAVGDMEASPTVVAGVAIHEDAATNVRDASTLASGLAAQHDLLGEGVLAEDAGEMEVDPTRVEDADSFVARMMEEPRHTADQRQGSEVVELGDSSVVLIEDELSASPTTVAPSPMLVAQMAESQPSSALRQAPARALVPAPQRPAADSRSASVRTPASDVASPSQAVHAQRAAARARVAVAARVASLAGRRATIDQVVDADAPVRAPQQRKRPPSGAERPPSGSGAKKKKNNKKKKKKKRYAINPGIVIALVVAGMVAILILSTVILIALWTYLRGDHSLLASEQRSPVVIDEGADEPEEDEAEPPDDGDVDSEPDEGETPGAVIVTSDPAGATVRVDGVLRGTTPLTLPQKTRAGTVEMQLSRDGYETQDVSVKFDGEQTVRVDLVRAKRAVTKAASSRPTSAGPTKPRKPRRAKKAPGKTKPAFGKW